jgi:hypothetical protein
MNDALWDARRSARRDDEDIVVCILASAVDGGAPRLVDNDARSESSCNFVSRSLRESLIQREDDIAIVPDPLHGRDEGVARRQIDGNESAHASTLEAPIAGTIVAS